MDERHSRNPRVVALAARALVGLLLAIAVPVARHRRQEARRRTCQANIRYMAFALAFYAEGWDGRFPPAGKRDDDDEYYWVRPLFGPDAGGGEAEVRADCSRGRDVVGLVAAPTTNVDRQMEFSMSSRLPRTISRARSVPTPQSLPKSAIAVATSQGQSMRPSTRASGPSDSVSTRSRGIRADRVRPRSPWSIAGPTVNQQPWAIAQSRSRKLPENQWRIGTPAPGCASRQSSTGREARRV